MGEVVPYWSRVGLLLLVMVLIAVIDWRRNGRKATKWVTVQRSEVDLG